MILYDLNELDIAHYEKDLLAESRLDELYDVINKKGVRHQNNELVCEYASENGNVYKIDINFDLKDMIEMSNIVHNNYSSHTSNQQIDELENRRFDLIRKQILNVSDFDNVPKYDLRFIYDKYLHNQVELYKLYRDSFALKGYKDYNYQNMRDLFVRE